MKRFALAGNPNCGKTTLFNNLTGSTAHVGNWPGVTVDKKEGVYKKCAEPIQIIDLPGIYSLSPYTPEEVIARNYVLDQKPDCVINIVDATNLERNLYLSTQIMEIDVPVVIALNMIDAVEKQGDRIDEKALEQKLGVPVVAISALKGTGLTELMERAYETCKTPRKGKTVLESGALAHLIGDVKIALDGQGVENPLFHAVKLAEEDELEVKAHKDTVKMVEEFKKTFNDDTFGDDFEALIADARYRFISKNFSSVVTKKNKEKFASTKSDKADKVLTHKIWGIPIFLVVLFAIFHLTFSEDFLYLGSIFGFSSLEELGIDTEAFGGKLLACFYDGAIFSPGVIINNLWNDIIVEYAFGWLVGLIEESGMSAWAIAFLNDGVIEGLKAVLSFLPPILVLFLFFSILEDSGYMARIAFILDRMFRKFGLSGRAFLPMIMGFGCSVPAMINTRTLADDKERAATIRVIPFFSCGAKLPILTAVAGAIVMYFGVGNADLITYGMYLLGIVSAILAVLFMRNTSLKGETPPFIMELPAYHAPQFKNLMIHLWDKTKHFIKKAFTIIVASTIVIWVLQSFSWSWEFLLQDAQELFEADPTKYAVLEEVEGLVNVRVNESILGSIGMLFQPIFTPLGFGSQLSQFGWVFVVAAVAGLIAKENVISTFATLAAGLAVSASIGIEGLDIFAEEGIDAVQAMIIATGISIPGLIAFIAFNMTTIPCFAAVGTAKAELMNSKSYHGTLLFWIISSFLVASAVYTIGSVWWTAFIWIAAGILTTWCIISYNKKATAKLNNNKLN